MSFKNGLGHQKQLMKMPTVDDNTFPGHEKRSRCSSQVVTLDYCFLGILKAIEKCLTSNFHWVSSSQYSCLENPMEIEAWQATLHKVTESDMAEVT